MSLTSIYRKIVPEKIRKNLYQVFVKQLLDNLDFVKHKFYYMCFSVIKPWTEKQKCLYFMGKYYVCNYPYSYYFEYINKEIEYHFDEELDLPYVIHNSKKLYFKKISKESVELAYRMLLLEQDIRSAHCYVDDYESLLGKTVFDVGTAEGIFALNAIEKAEHLYLFECEPDWIKPLKATFAPYKSKITIVEKYVSDCTQGKFITLDDYSNGKEIDNIYIKMDIEGFERKALKGSEELFNSNLKISGAICAYHREDDEKNITSFLKTYGFSFTRNKGYIYNERSLRAGVIRFGN